MSEHLQEKVREQINHNVEIWKDILGFEGFYQISTYGRVKSISRMVAKIKLNLSGNKFHVKEIILKSHLNGRGYYHVTICNKNGKRFTKIIHQLVAKAFIPNPENKPCTNHINGIKTDNYIENLEWVTHSENTQHAFKIGLQNSNHCTGSNNIHSKLTELDILEIRNNKDKSKAELARIYSVNFSTIALILDRKTWKHI